MSSPQSNLTAWQITELNDRKTILTNYLELMGQEPAISLRRAARELGVSRPRLTDIVERYEAKHDDDDLIPGIGSGRPSVRSQLEKAVGKEAVDSAIDIVRGHHLDTGTNSGSWRYCGKTGEIPTVIAQSILDDGKASKHNIPRSLTEPTKITSAEVLAHQGRRALKHSGLYIPRRIDVLPGDIFVSDDTTPIWGWWVPWPRSKQYPFGKKMLQGQLLLLIDYASGYRISYTLIAREKSSYRACDIWGWYGHVFDDVGLPRLGFQHEGGAWQAMLLRGQEIETEPGEPVFDRRVGALTGLPSTILPYHTKLGYEEKNLRVWRSREARSKPVEGAFGMMQPLEGTIWGYLGTDQRRNPIIKTKRLFEACQRGTADPGLHFLSGSEMMRRITPILEYLNQDAMEGPLRQGRPSDWWHETLEQHRLTKLDPEYRWLYRRDWVVRTLAGPFVECSYKDAYSGRNVRLHYHNAELFARLCDRRVVVYFDKQYPAKPAQIVSTDNEWLGEAQYWSGTGAFLDGNKQGFEIQANYVNTVMQLTKTIEAHCPSHQLPPEIAARRQEAEAMKRAEQQTPMSAPTRSTRAASPAPHAEAPESMPETPRRRAMTLAEIVNGDLPQTKISPPLVSARRGCLKK